VTDAGNRDERVIEDFGREWSTFDQSTLSETDREEMFGQYFSEFPWESLPPAAVGADIGCGSGRWAAMVVPRVGHLHCVDPSAQALDVARRNVGNRASFHCAGVDELPFAAGSLDFAYSLGVLHHVPDTEAALRRCAVALRPGAPFLVYLYYAFDNQPRWYRTLWRSTDLVRRAISRAPHAVRVAVSSTFALLVYLPLARLALLAELLGRDVQSFPLAYYRRRSTYVMRTDALDRFGTRLEHRFTRREVEAMLLAAGFRDVRFRQGTPYWTACARKA
jgi:SAM-dependent methyltransferase